MARVESSCYVDARRSRIKPATTVEQTGGGLEEGVVAVLAAGDGAEAERELGVGVFERAGIEPPRE